MSKITHRFVFNSTNMLDESGLMSFKIGDEESKQIPINDFRDAHEIQRMIDKAYKLGVEDANERYSWELRNVIERVKYGVV